MPGFWMQIDGAPVHVAGDPHMDNRTLAALAELARAAMQQFGGVMTTIPTADWRSLLDEKQRKEIAWASAYASEFNHGTTGHNQLILIARLAGLLDQIARDGVLSRPEPPLSAEIVLGFGKYSGKSLGEVWRIDSDYVRWLSEKARDEDVRLAALELLGQAAPRAPLTNAVLQGPLIEDGDAPTPAEPGVDIPF